MASDAKSSTASSETITTISPITQLPVLTRTGVSTTDIPALLSAATTAFSSYRSILLSKRQDIIRNALQIITARADALGREITEQMGRPIAYTAKEVLTAVKRGEYMLSISSEQLADTPGQEEAGFWRWIRKMPVGPVLVIFAWNVCYTLPCLALPVTAAS